VSPLLTKEVELFDPLSKKIIGFVTVAIQFKMTSVPNSVLSTINTSRGSLEEEGSDPGALSRIELGLKQAFKLADEDGSGSVTAIEVISKSSRWCLALSILICICINAI